jgi:hypothetical protein
LQIAQDTAHLALFIYDGLEALRLANAAHEQAVQLKEASLLNAFALWAAFAFRHGLSPSSGSCFSAWRECRAWVCSAVFPSDVSTAQIVPEY